jgi:hypothetical protein
MPRWATALHFVIPSEAEGSAVYVHGETEPAGDSPTAHSLSPKVKLQIPRLPPDFLSALVVPVNLMRLSSEKAAYVVVFESSVVGNPEFARDDKLEAVTFVRSH